MAQGFVQFQNQKIETAINNAKDVTAEFRRILDRLIVIRNGTSYDLVAAAVGAIGADQGDAGLKAFDNLDAAMAGLTTAYNALSNMDQGAL